MRKIQFLLATWMFAIVTCGAMPAYAQAQVQTQVPTKAQTKAAEKAGKQIQVIALWSNAGVAAH